ncbi:MAG TPA: alpha/beta fold hydrolase [Vicinamibacterales bacterium]
MRRLVTMVAVLGVPATVLAGPCMTPTNACAEWLVLGSGHARSLVYRSYPLDGRNDRIKRALIMVHGSDRDAGAYFQIGLAAARLAGALDDTIVIAPRFASRDGPTCRDTLAADEVNWPCEGNSWRSGGVATGALLTSFELADEILRKAAAKTVFPNLEVVVVAGHSAGGQFVTRYEMANRVHDTLGVRLRYVVANPSSYAYPDSTRPVVKKKVKGKTEFGPFEERSCAGYNRWPYGLVDRQGYAEKAPILELRQQLVARPTTYLLGGRDVLPLDGFDTSCAAMAQGPTRLARGQAFAAYVNQRLGAHHVVAVLPDCGHDPVCMFTADRALSVLFPKR